LAFGADSSVAVFESFNTGMNIGQRDPMKWIIVGASIGPAGVGDVPSVTDAGSYEAQLSIGTQAAMLEPDDMQVISSLTFMFDVLTSGAHCWQFPFRFPILSPIPVFAQTITVGMDGTNVAALQNFDYAYEIVYFTAPIVAGEIEEYLAAFGQV
jgi:hypothetical protein